MELASNLGFAIIDRMLGGRGETLDKVREFSEIELSLLERLLMNCVSLLREPWKNVVKIEPRLEQIETNSQFAQIIAPNETIAIITIKITVGKIEGLMNICLPYITLEPIMDKLNTKYWFASMSEHDEMYEQAMEIMIEKTDIIMKKLDVDEPDIWLKATENIDNIIDFISRLIQRLTWRESQP